MRNFISIMWLCLLALNTSLFIYDVLTRDWFGGTLAAFMIAYCSIQILDSKDSA